MAIWQREPQSHGQNDQRADVLAKQLYQGNGDEHGNRPAKKGIYGHLQLGIPLAIQPKEPQCQQSRKQYAMLVVWLKEIAKA